MPLQDPREHIAEPRDGAIKVRDMSVSLSIDRPSRPPSSGPVRQLTVHFNELPRSVRERLAALSGAPNDRKPRKSVFLTSMMGVLLCLGGLFFTISTLTGLFFASNSAFFLKAVLLGLPSGLAYFVVFSLGVLSIQRVVRHKIHAKTDFLLLKLGAWPSDLIRTIRGPVWVKYQQIDGWRTPTGWLQVVEFGTEHLSFRPWHTSDSERYLDREYTYKGVGGVELHFQDDVAERLQLNEKDQSKVISLLSKPEEFLKNTFYTTFRAASLSKLNSMTPTERKKAMERALSNGMDALKAQRENESRFDAAVTRGDTEEAIRWDPLHEARQLEGWGDAHAPPDDATLEGPLHHDHPLPRLTTRKVGLLISFGLSVLAAGATMALMLVYAVLYLVL